MVTPAKYYIEYMFENQDGIRLMEKTTEEMGV